MKSLFLYGFIFCLLTSSQSQINSLVTDKYTSDQIAITTIDDKFWLIQIGIGSPVQYFTVQVDSGSSYLWVPNTSCKSCSLTTQYNPTGQGDYQPTGATFKIKYGTGECSGIVANDQVGVPTSPMNTTMTMYFATYESGFGSSSQGFDGIMGLCNDQSIMNIFQVAYNNNEISSQIYGLALNQMPTDSYLIYNNINTQILNNAVWMQSTSNIYWQTQVLTMTMNGVNVYSYLGGINSAIIDSGTSALLVPYNLYSYLMSQYFEPQGCYAQSNNVECPCRPTNIATVPRLVIGFQGISVTIPYSSMLFQYSSSTAADTCELAISVNTITTGTMILGDPLFLSTIVLFNKADNELGFYN